MAANIKQNHRHIVSKVGIIGAGISGIAAAKQLSSHNPVVFEATDSIGGVWKHCSYNSTKLQTPRCDFEFSDYPWPDRDNSSFPSHLEVLDYLYGYAKHFDVLRHIKFNSKVVEIRYVGHEQTEHENIWEVHDLTNVNDLRQPGEFGRLLKRRPVWEVAVRHTSDQSDVVQVVPLKAFFFFFFHLILISQY